MCGIAGHFSAKPLPENTPDLLDNQLETLHHRGPDGRGQYVERKNGVALGHTRLAINDLEVTLLTGDRRNQNRPDEVLLLRCCVDLIRDVIQ